MDVVGTWRGLQINKGYIVGEWKAVFTLDNVTITRPDGDKFVGKVTSVSNYITIIPTSGPFLGKNIQTLWQITFGPATKLLTWAWGVPGGSAPSSYDSAMTETNNAEFVFASCLQGKEGVCNFDR